MPVANDSNIACTIIRGEWQKTTKCWSVNGTHTGDPSFRLLRSVLHRYACIAGTTLHLSSSREHSQIQRKTALSFNLFLSLSHLFPLTGSQASCRFGT